MLLYFASLSCRILRLFSTWYMYMWMQLRTEWTPLLREFQPRFSEDSEIELPSIKPNLLPDNSELKVSFSFDHDHYVTEWISIASGNGKFLNSLRFFLTYSGDHITDVSWKLVRSHASRVVARACASFLCLLTILVWSVCRRRLVYPLGVQRRTCSPQSVAEDAVG